MRIQFHHSKSGGPGIFMNRLRKYLETNFDVVITDRNPDIYVSAVWRGNPPKGIKTVHRVDNCYFDTLQHKRTGANSAIKVAIKRATAVVYQSDFSRKICKGVLGVKAKHSTVIHNGFDQKICDSVVPFEHHYKHLFVACADWRPIKRPNAIVKAFLKARIPDSALVMIGKNPPKVKEKNIIYTGSISPENTYKYYKAATALIHIARLDACPNSVVEALSFGKPVICNNAGGTPELVGNDGIIVKIDPEDNYKPFPMAEPEKVNTSLLAEGLVSCAKKEWNIHRPDLSMESCAKEYYSFFLHVFKL